MNEVKCPIFAGYILHNFIDVCAEKDAMRFTITIRYDENVFWDGDDGGGISGNGFIW
jgi:hypothetical protein